MENRPSFLEAPTPSLPSCANLELKKGFFYFLFFFNNGQMFLVTEAWEKENDARPPSLPWL